MRREPSIRVFLSRSLRLVFLNNNGEVTKQAKMHTKKQLYKTFCAKEPFLSRLIPINKTRIRVTSTSLYCEYKSFHAELRYRKRLLGELRVYVEEV